MTQTICSALMRDGSYCQLADDHKHDCWTANMMNAERESRDSMIRACLELVAEWSGVGFSEASPNYEIMSAIGVALTRGATMNAGANEWLDRARKISDRVTHAVNVCTGDPGCFASTHAETCYEHYLNCSDYANPHS